MSESGVDAIIPTHPESERFLDPTAASDSFLEKWKEGAEIAARAIVSKPGVAVEGTLADMAANFVVSSTAIQTGLNLGISAIVALREKPDLLAKIGIGSTNTV